MRLPTWAIFLAPLVPSVLLALSVWSDLRGFQERAPFLATQGHIAKVNCQNHGEYQVNYLIGEHVLTEGSGNHFLRKACSEQLVGETAEVWYSHNEPRYASFVSPDEALERMKGELAAFIFVPYPLWVAFLYAMSRIDKIRLLLPGGRSA